jgi:hypothetical protein
MQLRLQLGSGVRDMDSWAHAHHDATSETVAIEVLTHTTGSPRLRLQVALLQTKRSLKLDGCHNIFCLIWEPPYDNR